MSRVRSAALSSILALSLLGLAACGSEASDSDAGGKPLSSVTIEGKQGEEPEVTFDGRLAGSKAETEVVVEGDGETVADGDTVSANWWIGNGFTEEEAQSTYTKDGPDQQPRSRVERKRDRIRSEIRRNREGGHRVPTWVLAALLGALLLGWLYLIVTS